MVWDVRGARAYLFIVPLFLLDNVFGVGFAHLAVQFLALGEELEEGGEGGEGGREGGEGGVGGEGG